MSTIKLEAEVRSDLGKGSSRRLRRIENKVPGVIYGGDKAAQSIHLSHHKVVKALETESIYSSVFDVNVDGKVEQVTGSSFAAPHITASVALLLEAGNNFLQEKE